MTWFFLPKSSKKGRKAEGFRLCAFLLRILAALDALDDLQAGAVLLVDGHQLGQHLLLLFLSEVGEGTAGITGRDAGSPEPYLHAGHHAAAVNAGKNDMDSLTLEPGGFGNVGILHCIQILPYRSGITL